MSLHLLGVTYWRRRGSAHRKKRGRILCVTWIADRCSARMVFFKIRQSGGNRFLKFQSAYRPQLHSKWSAHWVYCEKLIPRIYYNKILHSIIIVKSLIVQSRDDHGNGIPKGFLVGMGIPWKSHGDGKWWQNWKWEWETPYIEMGMTLIYMGTNSRRSVA